MGVGLGGGGDCVLVVEEGKVRYEGYQIHYYPTQVCTHPPAHVTPTRCYACACAYTYTQLPLTLGPHSRSFTLTPTSTCPCDAYSLLCMCMCMHMCTAAPRTRAALSILASTASHNAVHTQAHMQSVGRRGQPRVKSSQVQTSKLSQAPLIEHWALVQVLRP